MQPWLLRVTVISCDEFSTRSCGCWERPISTFLVICREKRHWSKDKLLIAKETGEHTHTQASQHPFTRMHGQTNWENTNCCLHTWASTRWAFKSIPSLVYQSRLNVICTGRSTTCAHEHTRIQNKNYSTMSLYCEHAISACSNGAIW